jgi:hypothetical protein
MSSVKETPVGTFLLLRVDRSIAILRLLARTTGAP